MVREIESLHETNQLVWQESLEESRLPSPRGVLADKGSINKGSYLERFHFTNQMKRVHGEVLAPFGNGFTINSIEIKVIQDIIHYLDSRSTMALGLPSNQRHLKEEGKKIDHVHPLCFIWAIIKESSLRDKLRSFRDNSAFSLKWNGFMGYSTFHDKGFGKNLERYYNHRNPADYEQEFKNFCQVLRIKEEKVMPHVMIKSWRGFASALVEEDSYF